MTPPTLVQRARQLSPQHWKGQQTVIRRLSRTQRLPEETMHDALRRASKLYQADSPMHKMVTFRPNNDTPPDLRAAYLRDPHAFGMNSREDRLAWFRQASKATLLKMDELLGPVESVNMHKATLVKMWKRLVLADPRVQEWHVDEAKFAAVCWHLSAPSRQQCLDLAAMLEGTYAAESASFERLWQYKNPIFLPWVSMMGTNPEEGQRALDMYQLLDPGLLTFTTIANALSSPQLYTIDNVSELLFP